MALITVSGQPGCRHEDVARLAAQLLGFEFVTPGRLAAAFADQFGAAEISDKAFGPAAVSVVARLAAQSHLVVAVDGAELLFRDFPGLLRVRVVAPESRRAGTLMLEHRLDRAAARSRLRALEAEQRAGRKRRFGRATAPPDSFDLVCNAEQFEVEGVADLIEGIAVRRGLAAIGLLSPAAEARLQFQMRLKLSAQGIFASGSARVPRKVFVHPSEQVFASLLDFYRVTWEYEPRCFPLQWDKDGRVTEAFTPDFYLPEFDLYVELTTMKQSLVTKKNRKVKRLRALHPEINIQVFYQKDFENLVFKYGLAERVSGSDTDTGRGSPGAARERSLTP
ncbi:MAG TPA: cytidylate kinase family protein [Bryobacteraceae bacterium]